MNKKIETFKLKDNIARSDRSGISGKYGKTRLLSSSANGPLVEHQSDEQEVMGSNPTGDIFC